MAKDPAFLFYPGDWLGGTIGMTLEEKGAYIEVLILQFNRGHMSEHMIERIIGHNWQHIKQKFKQDAEGLYFNERLEFEKNKRKNFTESRRDNRLSKKDKEESTKVEPKKSSHKKNISASYDSHMLQHMENENENENINANELSIYPFSENFMQHWNEWKQYKIQQHSFKYKSALTEKKEFNRLLKLSQKNETFAIELIDNAIARAWEGIHIPNDKKQKQHEPANRDQARIEYWNHMVDTFGTDEEKATRKIV
jgi:hypothetical protein